MLVEISTSTYIFAFSLVLADSN